MERSQEETEANAFTGCPRINCPIVCFGFYRVASTVLSHICIILLIDRFLSRYRCLYWSIAFNWSIVVVFSCMQAIFASKESFVIIFLFYYWYCYFLTVLAHVFDFFVRWYDVMYVFYLPRDPCCISNGQLQQPRRPLRSGGFLILSSVVTLTAWTLIYYTTALLHYTIHHRSSTSTPSSTSTKLNSSDLPNQTQLNTLSFHKENTFVMKSFPTWTPEVQQWVPL